MLVFVLFRQIFSFHVIFFVVFSYFKILTSHNIHVNGSHKDNKILVKEKSEKLLLCFINWSELKEKKSFNFSILNIKLIY